MSANRPIIYYYCPLVWPLLAPVILSWSTPSCWAGAFSIIQPQQPPSDLVTSDDYYHAGCQLYQEYCRRNNDGNRTTLLLQAAQDRFQSAIQWEERRLSKYQHLANKAHNRTAPEQFVEPPDCDNLLVALRRLGLVYAEAGKHAECLATVDQIRYWKARKMPFVVEVEQPAINAHSHDNYQWIYAAKSNHHHPHPRKVALQTLGTPPLLNATARQWILAAAQRYRSQEHVRQQRYLSSSSSTRFTMQYVGNSDLHMADLCRCGPRLASVMNHLLQQRVYPLVRQAFFRSDDNTTAANNSSRRMPLCVYDALLVRYDGDAAVQHGQTRGAALPLHRDGGLVSVNIALNDPSCFQGGGTLLDALLVDGTDATNPATLESAVVRPVAPGHAVVHRSTERHAGAPTRTGTRHILVIFLTLRLSQVREPRSSSSSSSTSTIKWEGVERGFYLKELLTQHQQPSRSDPRRCWEWAYEQNPNDGEALFWVAFFRLQRVKRDLTTDETMQASQRHLWPHIEQGIRELELAANLLDPGNVRSLTYLASAYSFRWSVAVELQRQQSATTCKANAGGPNPSWWHMKESTELSKAKEVLKRAVFLQDTYECVLGTTMASDTEGACALKATALLHLGEVLVRLGRPDEAQAYVTRVEAASLKCPADLQTAMKQDGLQLMKRRVAEAA